jgi:hypothetical protein
MWHMARATGNPSLLLSPLGKYSEFTHFPSLFHAPAPSPIPLVFSLTNGPFSFSFHYLSLSYALFFKNLFYLPSTFLLFHIEEIPYFIYYNTLEAVDLLTLNTTASKNELTSYIINWRIFEYILSA